MLLVDAAGTIILANPSAENLSQRIRPKASLAIWFHAITGHREPDERLSEALCASAPSNLEFELPGSRHLAVNVYPLRKSEDNDRAVVYIRETTSEKRLLARMQQSEKLAALGRLAAGLAHEINNPLGVIQCYAQLLQKNRMEPQARADLDIILTHTQKAQAILKGLLGMARRNHNGASGNADLNEVIRGIVQIFRVQTDASGVTLDLDLAQDIPVVAADTSAIEQILTNLLVNALDAVPDRTGRIAIRTCMDPNRKDVLLRVSDNGPGIPPEHLKQIFDPFFTTKEIGKGTGLGLTVVYELMTEIGGTIDVQAGPGACFELRFPVAPSNDQPISEMDPDRGYPA
jgi:C4-dicarboxylate-specific signal transduction histidine kinase